MPHQVDAFLWGEIENDKINQISLQQNLMAKKHAKKEDIMNLSITISWLQTEVQVELFPHGTQEFRLQ